MASHAWTVLCRTLAKADGPPPRKSISLLDVVHSVTLHSQEAMDLLKAGEDVYVRSEMQLVSFWMRSKLKKPERAECRYSIRFPDGKELRQESMPLDLESAPAATVRLNFEAFPFRGDGLYELVTEVRELKGAKRRGWRTVASYPLIIQYQPLGAGQPAAPPDQ